MVLVSNIDSMYTVPVSMLPMMIVEAFFPFHARFTPPQDPIQEAKESITFVDGLSRDGKCLCLLQVSAPILRFSEARDKSSNHTHRRINLVLSQRLTYSLRREDVISGYFKTC